MMVASSALAREPVACQSFEQVIVNCFVTKKVLLRQLASGGDVTAELHTAYEYEQHRAGVGFCGRCGCFNYYYNYYYYYYY